MAEFILLVSLTRVPYRTPTVLRVVPTVLSKLRLEILLTLFLITTTPLQAVFITKLTLVRLSRLKAGPTMNRLPTCVMCILETGLPKGTLEIVSVVEVVSLVRVLGTLMLLVEKRTTPMHILVRKPLGNKGWRVWLMRW